MISDIIINKIQTKAGKRKICALGWNEKSAEELRLKGIDFEKCFTGNNDIIKKNSNFYFNIKELANKKTDYYIVVLVNNPNNPDSQRNMMKTYGYTEGSDYIYLKPYDVTVIENKQAKYSDEYGNLIINLPSNTAVSLSGWGNRIKFGDGIDFDGKLIIKISGNNNELEFGDGFSVAESVTNISCTGDNNRLRIKENCRILNSGGESKIQLLGNALFRCGKNAVISAFEAGIVRNTFLEIGDYCMFSHFVLIQTGDGYSIFDIDTKENISSAAGKRKGVVLGNHVWVGMRSFILPCNVGDGSIIGAQSVIKGRFPNNCAIAGSPAAVVRKNIAWSSVNEANDISLCLGYVNQTDSSLIIPGYKEKIAELEKRVSELEGIIDKLKSSEKRRLFRK